MEHYFNIYKTLLKMNLFRLLIYRSNFFNTIVSSIAYGIFSFLYIILLTSKTPVIYDWRREELILLMAFYNIVVGGVFHTVFSYNFNEFADTIHFGRLDGVLLKPVNSQFLMSVVNIAYAQLSRFIMGVGVAIYIIYTYKITVTILGLIEFIILSAFGLLTLYSIWFMVMALTVWNTRLSNLVDLLYHLNDLVRFPPKMYKQVINYVFFIFPFTIILITPAKAILQRLTIIDVMLLIFFSLFLFFLSRKFWQFALRSYTSASS